jgi:hypothetical protein
MPSKLNSPSAEGEAEAEVEVTEEEGEVQAINTQVKVTPIKKGIRITSLKEAEGGDPMTNQAYNVITAKSMDTMNLNAGRSRQINTQAKAHVSNHEGDTSGGMFLSCNKIEEQHRISGCWTVDATII